MLRRIHKRMPKQLASDERERERESQPQVSQNQYNTTKKKNPLFTLNSPNKTHKSVGWLSRSSWCRDITSNKPHGR